MAHSSASDAEKTLPLSQGILNESDEGNFSSDESSVLDDSGDEDYCPSDEVIDEESVSDIDTYEAPASSSHTQELEPQMLLPENCQLDGLEDTSPPKKKRRTHRFPQKDQSWKTDKDSDITPPTLRFHPAREPGVQLSSSDSYTPLDVFKLFFSEKVVQVLCRNTNKAAAKNQASGAKYRWTDVTVPDFYRYIGMVFYMALFRLSKVSDYWRRDSIFSIPFPGQVMPRERFRTISWNVHMSDPDEDKENDGKKGTPLHDRLFRAKPLMNSIQDACKAYYHPRKNLAIDERMVACKAHTGMTQYMKAKPTKWGIKLFVLADSSNGYTVAFSVFTGKNHFASGNGLPYDTVMSLINKKYLGSGYHIYMDNFYTSEKLLKDLYDCNYGACGTYRDSLHNVLTQRSERGSFRWLRNGPLVFVKWMDSREVNICSTIHTAYNGQTIKRKIKDDNGIWTSKFYPCPQPVIEYNKHMGGVDLSDQLIQYYSAQHRVIKWYKKLFFHFLDIAATNAYLIYKEKNQDKMTHITFLEELTAQLCGHTTRKLIVKERQKKIKKSDHGDLHLPVPALRDGELDSRRNCVYCTMYRPKYAKTLWKCQACDIFLCLRPERNCFEAWHTTSSAS